MDLNTLHSICILGAGKEGVSAAEFLLNQYPHLRITLADQRSVITELPVALACEKNYPESLAEWDAVIVSPGIPPHTPLLATARAITTATNIFLAECRGTVVGVTGSKGKSTTSSLIAHILRTAQLPAHLVGNIGAPALHTLHEHNDANDIFVFEMSSYQASRLEKGPDIAVIINLFPEHMNYHGSLEQYYNDKMRMTTLQTNEQVVIYNSENAELTQRIATSRAKKIAYPHNDTFHLRNDGVYAGNTRLSTFEELPLKGMHNASNIIAALTAATTVRDIPDDTLHAALLSFKPLHHRLEVVGHQHDITWIDDAISTTPESTLAAIAAYPNTGAIILGGLDRGYDFTTLAHEIAERKIPVIVFLPDSGSTIERALHAVGWIAPHTLHTSSMQEAVSFIAKNCPKNTATLLSCASPSYTVFKNFEDKGDQFQKYVRELN